MNEHITIDDITRLSAKLEAAGLSERDRLVLTSLLAGSAPEVEGHWIDASSPYLAVRSGQPVPPIRQSLMDAARLRPPTSPRKDSGDAHLDY